MTESDGRTVHEDIEIAEGTDIDAAGDAVFFIRRRFVPAVIQERDIIDIQLLGEQVPADRADAPGRPAGILCDIQHGLAIPEELAERLLRDHRACYQL